MEFMLCSNESPDHEFSFGAYQFVVFWYRLEVFVKRRGRFGCKSYGIGGASALRVDTPAFYPTPPKLEGVVE